VQGLDLMFVFISNWDIDFPKTESL